MTRSVASFEARVVGTEKTEWRGEMTVFFCPLRQFPKKGV
jgi:hypothetical protein